MKKKENIEYEQLVLFEFISKNIEFILPNRR